MPQTCCQLIMETHVRLWITYTPYSMIQCKSIHHYNHYQETEGNSSTSHGSHKHYTNASKKKNKFNRSLVKNGFENKVKFAYYKRYRNQLAHLLVLSKKEYYQSQFLIARNDSAKTWKIINTLLPGRTKATSKLAMNCSVLSVFIDLRSAECVCSYYGLRFWS